MKLHLDGADFRETDAIIMGDGKATCLGVGEGIVAALSLEAGKPWRHALLEPTKAAIKSPLEPQEHILQHLGVDVVVFFPQVLDLGQITLLLVVGYLSYTLVGYHHSNDHLSCLGIHQQLCALMLLVGILPFGKRSVVEFPASG